MTLQTNTAITSTPAHGRLQPWKSQWPPQGPVSPLKTKAQKGQNVVLVEGGGGAYPNKIMESQGVRF